MYGWAKEITRVEWVPTLGDTPARVNRKTGVMYLSMSHMLPLPKEIRLIIMLHEMAHVELQTTDEEACDAWAFKKYADMGYSLTAAVKATTRVLNDQNPEHLRRMQLQLQRAIEYDREHYGNKNI